MSGPWKHEWKSVTNIWPSSTQNHLVVDKSEADAHVAMLVNHCEYLTNRIAELKKMLADSQAMAKEWMNLATQVKVSEMQSQAKLYNTSLKQASLAMKEAHQNMNDLVAQLEAEGVVVFSEPASHALDGVKYYDAFFDEHGLEVGPTIEIEAPTWPMPYAPKEALPRWVPDAETLEAASGGPWGVVSPAAVLEVATGVKPRKHDSKKQDLIPYAKFIGNMAKVAAGKSFCQYDPEAKKLRVFVLISADYQTGDLVVCAGVSGEQQAKAAHEALESIAQACCLEVGGASKIASKFVEWCNKVTWLSVTLHACNVPSSAPWSGSLVEAPAKAKPAIAESSLADYVKWQEGVVTGGTKVTYDEGSEPPKHGTWIHYDAFFGTLTLHAEDSAGYCFEHWTTQCPNKTRAAEAAEKFKQLLDEYNKHDAVVLFKKWWPYASV